MSPPSYPPGWTGTLPSGAYTADDMQAIIDDRDSWAQQASDRVADAVRIIEERDSLIAAAIQAERERCAAICEAESAKYNAAALEIESGGRAVTYAVIYGQENGCLECAAAIRGDHA